MTVVYVHLDSEIQAVGQLKPRPPRNSRVNLKVGSRSGFQPLSEIPMHCTSHLCSCVVLGMANIQNITYLGYLESLWSDLAGHNIFYLFPLVHAAPALSHAPFHILQNPKEIMQPKEDRGRRDRKEADGRWMKRPDHHLSH